MRLRGVGIAVVLALGCACAWGSTAKPVARTKAATQGVPRPKLVVNGKPADGAAIVQGEVPLLRLRFAVATVPVGRTGVTIEEAAAGEMTVSRPEAIVRVRAWSKQMYVDGQSTPLPTAAISGATGLYVPVEVLQALYPDYTIALAYEASTRTVQFAYEAKPVAPAPAPAATLPAPPPVATAPATPPAASAAACAPSGPSRGVATQEFGKKGAKLEIVAALPITHGCHVRTEAELKKAYEKHPEGVHLTIYDLFGTDGQKFVAENGGQRAVVFINGKTSFDLGGRKITFEKMEDMLYRPADIVPTVDQELSAK